MMLIYNNDIVLIESDDEFLDQLILTLNDKFSLKFLGDVYYFLGLEVCKTPIPYN